MVLGMLGACIGQVHSQQQLSPQSRTQFKRKCQIKNQGLALLNCYRLFELPSSEPLILVGNGTVPYNKHEFV